MVLVDTDSELLDCVHQPFPRDVEFVLSALEAGPRPIQDRHMMRRSAYRVRASLELFSDLPETPQRIVYTRDISSRAMGFLSDHPLPLSHGGTLRLPGPTGTVLRIACTVLRCRQAAPGWFEGAVYFNRPQSHFDADQISGASSASSTPQTPSAQIPDFDGDSPPPNA
jgi:hypothetical protein